VRTWPGLDLLRTGRYLDSMTESSTEGTPVRFRVIVEVDEDGVFVAECPSLPGCVSQGATRAEAIENIRDAMIGYLESLKKHGDPIPPSIHEEIVEVAV